MKETFGGAFMLRMFLVIFILFFVFICISANYARAFRIKNGVIDIIEQYEGLTLDAEKKINYLIGKTGYRCASNDPKYGGSVTNYVLKREYGTFKGYENINSTDGRYNIQVCVDWDLPIINTQGTWVIKGKTEIIKNIN